MGMLDGVGGVDSKTISDGKTEKPVESEVQKGSDDALAQELAGKVGEAAAESVYPGLGIQKIVNEVVSTVAAEAAKVVEEHPELAEPKKEKEPLTVIDAHMNVYHGLNSLVSTVWNWLTSWF